MIKFEFNPYKIAIAATLILAALELTSTVKIGWFWVALPVLVALGVTAAIHIAYFATRKLAWKVMRPYERRIFTRLVEEGMDEADAVAEVLGRRYKLLISIMAF